MNNLFQRNWYTEVRRSDDKLLAVKTSYLDTDREAVAHMLVDINTFIVKEALWVEQRPLKPLNERTRRVTPLIGTEAYFSSGPVLKEAGKFINDPIAVAAFTENIIALIQAETYILEERGFASKEAYEGNWVNFYTGSCRYYSHPDRVTQSWYTYLGDSKRDDNLFVRFKTQGLFGLTENQYLLIGNLSDSFHEVNVNIKLNGFIVEKATGVSIRTPDPVCKEATGFLDNLQGINLQGLPKKEIAGILGKGQGCVHLIDLVNNCAQILDLYQF